MKRKPTSRPTKGDRRTPSIGAPNRATFLSVIITSFVLTLQFAVSAMAAPVPIIPQDSTPTSSSKIAFWNTQRRGANCFNAVSTREWWIAAKDARIEIVRLAPDKWPSQHRDFLIGNADRYEGLIAADFLQLKTALDQAESAGIRVVLTMLSLPGARWRQHNGDQSDLRLWRDTTYWTQAARFWHDLANRLRDHPAVVGYNLLNEPTPEFAAPSSRSAGNPAAWYASVENTAADLNGFYRTVIAAIRSVDDQTPVILDAGSWASAAAFAYLKPASDDKTLYAFHMYEPFEFTNKKANGGRFCFPGMVITESGDTVTLDLSTLQAILSPVADWQRRHRISTNRIIAAEFGCHRTTCGAADYLADLIQIFNGQNWHWAFYSFHEDGWDGMDYELGDKPPGAAYWQAVQQGKKPTLPRMKNRIWDAIRSQLR